MLVSAKPEADFSWWCAGKRSGHLHFVTHPHLSSICDLLTPVLCGSHGVQHHYWQHQTVEAQGGLGGECYDLRSGLPDPGDRRTAEESYERGDVVVDGVPRGRARRRVVGR
jgi:hypothetical protein